MIVDYKLLWEIGVMIGVIAIAWGALANKIENFKATIAEHKESDDKSFEKISKDISYLYGAVNDLEKFQAAAETDSENIKKTLDELKAHLVVIEALLRGRRQGPK